MSAIQRAINPCRLVPRLGSASRFHFVFDNKRTSTLDLLGTVNGAPSLYHALGERAVRKGDPKVVEFMMKQSLCLDPAAAMTNATSALGKQVWDEQIPKPLAETSMTEGSKQISPGSRHSY